MLSYKTPTWNCRRMLILWNLAQRRAHSGDVSAYNRSYVSLLKYLNVQFGRKLKKICLVYTYGD